MKRHTMICGGGGTCRFLTACLLALLATFTLSSDARAADTCPEASSSWFQDLPDFEDGAAVAACPCSNVDLGSTFAVVCDLDPGGIATAGGTIVAVHDPGFGGGGAICNGSEYCAWGVGPGGSDFVCEWDHTWVKDSVSHNLIRVNLVGTGHEDVLAFNYSTYDMDVWASETALAGVLKGKSGEDILLGSRADSGGYYTESLFGDDDNDLLCGFPGNDELTGGNHDDILCAMEGSDVNYGAGGHYDYLDHGSGTTDTNDGGPGNFDECNTLPATGCEATHSSNLCAP